MKARANRSARLGRPDDRRILPVDSSLKLSPDEVERYASAHEAWHWGIPPQRVVDWNDPDLPRALIQCGRLVRLHFRSPRDAVHPRRSRDTMIEFSQSVSKNSHIAYDPNHPLDRLYLLVAPSARVVLKQRFWSENEARPVSLNTLAAAVGGKHGSMNDYPRVMVKPIGVLTAVVYACHKKGDSDSQGGSFYIHKCGEVSGQFAALGVDQQGRLWIAGGSSRSPTAGISD